MKRINKYLLLIISTFIMTGCCSIKKVEFPEQRVFESQNKEAKS